VICRRWMSNPPTIRIGGLLKLQQPTHPRVRLS
jgi:hypothetical protein